MDFSNKKKNLIAGIGSVFVVGALGVAINFVIFGEPDKPRVLKPTPFVQASMEMEVKEPTGTMITDTVEIQQLEVSKTPKPIVVSSAEDEPQILELTMLPLNHEAFEILKYSKQLSIETVRAKALLEQSKGDKLAGLNQPVAAPSTLPMTMPVMLPEMNNEYSSKSDADNMPISEQIVIRAIMRVDDAQSGVIGFGSEVVPVRIGSKFAGVEVTKITDNSITFSEKSKSYTRYLGKQAVTVKGAKA